jgi:K+-transporting ATPase KdpF subunit
MLVSPILRVPHGDCKSAGSAAFRSRMEMENVGRDLPDRRAWLLRRCDLVSHRVRPPVRRDAVILDYALGALVTIGLLIYLVYVLVRPEKF